MTLMCEYALYALLVFGYLASASIGLQIKYQLIDRYQKPNYLSLGLAFAYLVIVCGYVVWYIKQNKYFGEFFKEMEKFCINERFICFLIG